MRRDGDLVLLDRTNGHDLWDSQSARHPGAYAVLQRSGNLVVYWHGIAVYVSGTGRRGGRLAVQNDGEAVIYSPSGRALWSSRAAGRQLYAGERLLPGQARAATGAPYRLVMQLDGNLVETTGPTNRVLWSSQTGGHPGAWATLQTDGQLVVWSPSRTLLYTSGKTRQALPRLIVQNDGNVVIYTGRSSPLWWTGEDGQELQTGQVLLAGQSRTSPNGQYLLAMQKDGNLVLYSSITSQALWSTRTSGPGNWATLQTDGNFVVYSAMKAPLFATGTTGGPDSFLAVQDDGNVVVYSGPDGTALWDTGRFPHTY